jgi:hypothetical protein
MSSAIPTPIIRSTPRSAPPRSTTSARRTRCPSWRAPPYVFDLGYYDDAWWAKLHAANCRIVTRLKKNTPLTPTRERLIPPGGIATSGATILSDRIGHLPARQAGSRSNPMSGEVREVRVRLDTGKVLRILTNDLLAPAHAIADLYKQRWQACPCEGEGRAVLPLDQAAPGDQALHRHLRERGAHPGRRRIDRGPADATGACRADGGARSARVRPQRPRPPAAPARHQRPERPPNGHPKSIPGRCRWRDASLVPDALRTVMGWASHSMRREIPPDSPGTSPAITV